MNNRIIKNCKPVNIIALMLFAMIAFCISSCKESGDVFPPGKPANLNVINADTAALNIYQNGARLNNISSIAPGSPTGYMSVPFGTKIYQVKKAGAVDYLINNYQLTLDTTRYYSLFIAGETADKLFLANDGLPPFAANMGLVRFVNASAVTSNLDVYIGNLTFTNQPFKAITPFNNITGGVATAVTIYQHGFTTPLASGSITFQTGTAYTLYTTGIPGGSGQNKFAAALVIN